MIAPPEPYRCALVRGWNFLAESLSGPDQDKTLSVEALLAKAGRGSSRNPEPPEETVRALRQFINALNKSAELHAFGRYYVTQMLVGLLMSRRRLAALWEHSPAILQRPVNRPLIILGLPRSGTSLLFNLLARDSTHRYLANWEVTVPQVPPQYSGATSRDRRRLVGSMLMRFQRYLAPQLEDIHEFYLDGPEECTPLLMQGFNTQALAGMFNVPEYSHWLNGVDHLATYQHHKRILQTLQDSNTTQRWLLKSPDHLAALRSIMSIYPDACLVHLHRDPVSSVASWASLNAAFRDIWSTRNNPRELGLQILERLATDMRAYLAARASFSKHVLDIPYLDLVREPIATVAQIYTHFGFELRPEAEQRMQNFLSTDRLKRRTHKYAPEDFGLTPAQIRAAFSEYMDRFDIQAQR